MDFLKEQNGKDSTVRLAYLVCAGTSCAVAIMAVYLDRSLADVAFLIGALLAPTGLTKAIQKGKEL